MSIEQRIEALEKEVAALKEQASKPPEKIVLPDNLAKELRLILSQQGVARGTSR